MKISPRPLKGKYQSWELNGSLCSENLSLIPLTPIVQPGSFYFITLPYTQIPEACLILLILTLEMLIMDSDLRLCWAVNWNHKNISALDLTEPLV